MPSMTPERASGGRMPCINFASRWTKRRNINGFRYTKISYDVTFCFAPYDDDIIRSRRIASPSAIYRQQRKMKVVKRKARISRGTFEYQRDGKTYQGTFTVENRYVNLSTQH